MILRNYNITYVLSFSNTDIDVASRNAILIKFKCVQLKFATLDIARLPTVLLFIYNCSPFALAFVGSICLGMVWFASPLAGYLCDRFGCRITCFLGSSLCISGLVATSYVHSLTLMYFTYSALYGLGTCFIYNPCFLVIPKYFTEKLSLATGVVSLGSSVGVLYTGPLLQVFLDSFEWRNTFRIMAATYALVCIFSLSFNPNVEETTIVEKFNTEENNKEEIRNEKTGISLYFSVWLFPAYTVIVTSFTFASFGMYIPYINLVSLI